MWYGPCLWENSQKFHVSRAYQKCRHILPLADLLNLFGCTEFFLFLGQVSRVSLWSETEHMNTSLLISVVGRNHFKKNESYLARKSKFEIAPCEAACMAFSRSASISSFSFVQAIFKANVWTIYILYYTWLFFINSIVMNKMVQWLRRRTDIVVIFSYRHINKYNLA